MNNTLQSQLRWGRIFLLPAFTVYIAFLVIPLLSSFVLSFFSWDGLSRMEFIGIGNFVKILSDGTFWNSIANNLIYAMYTIIFGNLIALTLALLLEGAGGNKGLRGRELFRFLLFSQFILSWVVVGFLWKRILNPFDGLLNVFLRTIGLDSLTANWLGDPATAMASVSIASIWRGFGFGLIIYSAGIRNIPVQLMEAARIDGADKWQISSGITLPLLRPLISIVVMLNLIDSFRVIDPFLVMTTSNPIKSVQVLGVYLYKTGFDYYKLGYSSSMAVFMFIIVTLGSLIYFRLQKKSNT